MRHKKNIGLYFFCMTMFYTASGQASDMDSGNANEISDSSTYIPETIRDELAAMPDPNQWQFQLAPLYLWFAGIQGESSIGSATAPLDVTFGDLFNNLETIFTFHFEAKKNRWGAFVDYMLIDISAEQSGQFGTGPMGNPIGVSVATDVRNNIVEFGGSYSLWEAYPLFELIAGIRYTNLEISAVPVANNVPVSLPSVSINEDLWDVFAGVRFAYEFGDNSGWSLVGRADVGGGSSDLTWSALAAIDWQYKSWGSVRAGYKWLGYDYETGSGPSRFSYDVVYEGPIVGLVFNW